jgi:hypothetical protein
MEDKVDSFQTLLRFKFGAINIEKFNQTKIGHFTIGEEIDIKALNSVESKILYLRTQKNDYNKKENFIELVRTNSFK